MKKNFSPFKMKFSIQEAGGEKQIFFTFKEASEKTGLTSKNIARVLKSGRNKYFRRSDKKLFGFRMKIQLHLFRSMEKIFSPRKKYRRDLEFLEQFFSINFAKNERIFWIPRKNPMKSLGHLLVWRNLLIL